MVLADVDFTNALRRFVQREDFQKIFRISADQKQNQQDLEYAVRLVVHTHEEFPRGRDVQEFLDQAILKVMSEHNRRNLHAAIARGHRFNALYVHDRAWALRRFGA